MRRSGSHSRGYPRTVTCTYSHLGVQSPDIVGQIMPTAENDHCNRFFPVGGRPPEAVRGTRPIVRRSCGRLVSTGRAFRLLFVTPHGVRMATISPWCSWGARRAGTRLCRMPALLRKSPQRPSLVRGSACTPLPIHYPRAGSKMRQLLLFEEVSRW